VPSGIEEARAQAAEMKSLGVKSLYVANDGSDYGRAIADAVAGDAKADGISAAKSLGGAAAAFYGAQSPAAAAKFFNHAASTAPSVKLFGPSSLNTSSFSSAISGSVHNLYVSIPGYLPKDLPAAGKAFVTAFKTAYHHTPNVEAIFGYEAMSALLRVLASEGNKANERATVVNGFIDQRKVSSVLGTYSIDSSGNTSLDAFVFARMSGGKLVPFAAAPLG
jgi:ABC-type branched-subunit amino acid transport system substrate-binding protein